MARGSSLLGPHRLFCRSLRGSEIRSRGRLLSTLYNVDPAAYRIESPTSSNRGASSTPSTSNGDGTPALWESHSGRVSISTLLVRKTSDACAFSLCSSCSVNGWVEFNAVPFVYGDMCLMCAAISDGQKFSPEYRWTRGACAST